MSPCCCHLPCAQRAQGARPWAGHLRSNSSSFGLGVPPSDAFVIREEFAEKILQWFWVRIGTQVEVWHFGKRISELLSCSPVLHPTRPFCMKLYSLNTWSSAISFYCLSVNPQVAKWCGEWCQGSSQFSRNACVSCVAPSWQPDLIFPSLGGCCCQGVSFVALPDRGVGRGPGVFWGRTGAQRWGGPWGEDFCSQQGVIFCLGEQLPIPYKLFLSVSLGALIFIRCGEWEMILFAISFCSAALPAGLRRSCLFLSVQQGDWQRELRPCAFHLGNAKVC